MPRTQIHDPASGRFGTQYNEAQHASQIGYQTRGKTGSKTVKQNLDFNIEKKKLQNGSYQKTRTFLLV